MHIFVTLMLSGAGSAIATSAACTAFKNQLQTANPDYTSVTTTFYPANAPVNIANNVYSIRANTLPAFCRVQFTIPTSPRTNVKVETWLPEPGAWTGRYVGFGNAGLAGAVDVTDLGYLEIGQGFAAMSTDMGHTDVIFGFGEWGIFNEDARIDFGYRATHLATVAAKALVPAYYGRPISKSYWMGCSTGGRQGWKEAQEYPNEYDGIIVGAPANYETHLQPWILHQQSHVLPVNGSTWIPASLWSVIHDEVIRQCDTIDGVKDGLIEDPRRCPFQPQVLACRPGQNGTNCLTPPQLNALRQIYAPWIAPNGAFIFDGYEVGGELLYPVPVAYAGPTVFPISLGYFDWVYNTTSYTTPPNPAKPPTITYQDVLVADREDVGQANAIDPDVRQFVNGRKGKIIGYFGWTDQYIAPRDNLRMYNSVQQFMRPTNPDVDDYYRVFAAPGMGHCYGGDGANGFGQSGTFPLTPPISPSSPDDNVLLAMVRWVETGQAPDSIVATKWNDDDKSHGLKGTKRVCKVPLTARYKGAGSVWDANNFVCA